MYEGSNRMPRGRKPKATKQPELKNSPISDGAQRKKVKDLSSSPAPQAPFSGPKTPEPIKKDVPVKTAEQKINSTVECYYAATPDTISVMCKGLLDRGFSLLPIVA